MALKSPLRGIQAERKRRGAGGVLVPPLDFNGAAFAESMAKRAGTVFAGAPIVQGKWDGSGVPDVLSFARGNQVSGFWYDNFDAYQGGGFCVWTPEQSSADRTDGNDAYIWRIGATRFLRYQYDTNTYVLSTYGWTISVAATITAGTPEYLAWGFDTNNKLDGTNYAYVSRNDTQTYGVTTQPTVAVPLTGYIGSTGTASPANGIIEGLVFVREIPWTGAFGTDMGQGDIVAAHAAGNDVAESIASWGTTWSMPTDATPGALVTGTGEAWSHPHADAETNLTDAFCQTTYGASGWATAGGPSAGPADQAAATKVFPWGYDWTVNAADDGIEQAIAGLTPGANYVLRVIAHCTTADDIRVSIDDDTNGGALTNFPDYDFGANTSRTAPGVALVCFELPTIARNGVGADCVAITIRIAGTANAQIVYCHQIELQDNLIDNPGLETGAGNPWIPDGWVNVSFAAGEAAQDGADFHSGASSIDIDASSTRIMYDQFSQSSGNFYAIGFWSKLASGNPQVGDLYNRIRQQATLSSSILITASGAAWTHHAAVGRAVSGSGRWSMLVNGAGDGKIDDLYYFALDAVSITAVPANQANSTEDTGLRVDGLDVCTQGPGNAYRRHKARYRASATPRHDLGDVGDWGNLYGYVFIHYENANNWIYVREEVGAVRMAFNAQGAGIQQGVWAGPWNAADQQLVDVRRTAAGAVLRMDGVPVITINAACVFATDFTQVVDWCTDENQENQFDGTIAAP